MNGGSGTSRRLWFAHDVFHPGNINLDLFYQAMSLCNYAKVVWLWWYTSRYLFLLRVRWWALIPHVQDIPFPWAHWYGKHSRSLWKCISAIKISCPRKWIMRYIPWQPVNHDKAPLGKTTQTGHINNMLSNFSLPCNIYKESKKGDQDRHDYSALHTLSQNNGKIKLVALRYVWHSNYLQNELLFKHVCNAVRPQLPDLLF